MSPSPEGHYSSQVPYSWETRSKYLELPFPLSEYKSRLEKIRRGMEANGLDAILVFGNQSDDGDLVYVSNFMPFGRAAVIVSKDKEPVIVTDAILHGEPINSYAWMTWIRDFVPVKHDPALFAETIARILKELGAKRIGLVGSENLPMAIWEQLKQKYPEGRWEDFSFQFLEIKSVRSDLEVALQRELGKITAEAMKASVESMSPGVTENEIVGVANKVMFERGAHDRSFPTIVNSGPRGGLKHSYPTSRKIEKGDMVYLDMGAMKFGYQIDMSRTVVVGGASKQQKEVLDVIQNGYETLFSMMKPGTKTSELISKAHELEEKSGLEEKFRGRIYLGLVVHHAIATSFFELPSLGLPDTVLKENMSFAFEPMAHILDFGTAVIEDTVLITKNGAESLTPYETVHW